MARLSEVCAALCFDEAEHGTKSGFEVMPFAMIDALKDSLTMVGGAGAANGGIIFDLWHLAKLQIPYQEVQQIPLKWIVGVELNDGTFVAPSSLHEDTVNHPRVCAVGEFDLTGSVACVR